ncbi:predicted protein [Naegleria gruberi]|uniref:Predicted protein n=1 Tax=Naegleria gruberi TaxID=5762 RepID=D2V4Q9_NAEGR|nr:uncharacterized protein NAEGRDRAFT_63875 [Naegleria gruberi]EFC48145.1 predicted protein [Naegleria gruberi]|eukprot:XP_002680889.1 predicted protein [Naegleria gruberi strain NEG-M]
MHPHQLNQTLSERKRNLVNNTQSSSTTNTESSSALKSFIGNANYRFLIGQIITCLVFIIYGVLMMMGEEIVESFLVRAFYFEIMLLLIFILIPIYLLFTFSSNIFKGRESNKRNDGDEQLSPSGLLVQMMVRYFGVLFGGACLIYVGVTLFGFTPFMRIPSSNNFQSARSDVEQTPMNNQQLNNNWICAKNIPASILNSEDHYVFSLFSKCHIFSIDEIKCCIVWCILSSLVIFVQPMATLLQWNNIKEYINLVVLEKTARVRSISFNLKPVSPLRTFLLVHLICIWISGFVIPLDWEKDWQYFPICTTVGLIFGSITNLIITLVTMKVDVDDTKED